MNLFYNNQYVHKHRLFIQDDVLMAEIWYGNNTAIVRRSELSEFKKAEEVDSFNNDDYNDEKVKGDDSADENNLSVIIAISVKDNSETELGTWESETFNQFVEDNKLDAEAINRVLKGEQRTHKGFSFRF